MPDLSAYDEFARLTRTIGTKCVELDANGSIAVRFAIHPFLLALRACRRRVWAIG